MKVSDYVKSINNNMDRIVFFWLLYAKNGRREYFVAAVESSPNNAFHIRLSYTYNSSLKLSIFCRWSP